MDLRSSNFFVNSHEDIYLITAVIMLLWPFRNAIPLYFCADPFLPTAELEDASRPSHSARALTTWP